MRVLVDTNIIISAALFPEGTVACVLEHLFETHTVVIASYSVHECEQVFKRKFPARLALLHRFMADIDYECFDTPDDIDPLLFPTIRDIHDVPILASAILANVDVLLSGDKDFEGLHMKKPLVFSPQHYCDLIKR